MVAIDVRNAPRDFDAYKDIWDKLYAQKLNKEQNAWLKVAMSDLPQLGTQAYKDIYSAYQYDQDMARQEELDALDKKLKEQEYATAAEKQQLMQDMKPYRQKLMDEMKTAFDNADEKEKLKFLPYMSLGGIYGY